MKNSTMRFHSMVRGPSWVLFTILLYLYQHMVCQIHRVPHDKCIKNIVLLSSIHCISSGESFCYKCIIFCCILVLCINIIIWLNTGTCTCRNALNHISANLLKNQFRLNITHFQSSCKIFTISFWCELSTSLFWLRTCFISCSFSNYFRLHPVFCSGFHSSSRCINKTGEP